MSNPVGTRGVRPCLKLAMGNEAYSLHFSLFGAAAEISLEQGTVQNSWTLDPSLPWRHVQPILYEKCVARIPIPTRLLIWLSFKCAVGFIG